LRVRSAGQTDPGRVRGGNEDHFLVAVLSRALRIHQTSLRHPEVQCGSPEAVLFLVADGVGGQAGGAHASAAAVNAVEDYVLDTLNWCLRLRGPSADADEVLLREFQKALEQADRQLFLEARQRPELSGMGTTLTLAYLLDDELFVAHAGDSRAYLWREGRLHRLTHDHTLVAEMVRHGYVSPEDAAHHNLRHVITNVVGGPVPGVSVELHKVPLRADDRLLLCTDGLTEMVPDQEIAGVLAAGAAPAEVCTRLIERANAAGGKDNITVVVARFEA
jgi:protein phosphatase